MRKSQTSGQDDIKENVPVDPNSPPLIECSISCDNLLCDALGRSVILSFLMLETIARYCIIYNSRSPSPRVTIYLRNSDHGLWRLYASTEIVEVCFPFPISLSSLL